MKPKWTESICGGRAMRLEVFHGQPAYRIKVPDKKRCASFHEGKEAHLSLYPDILERTVAQDARPLIHDNDFFVQLGAGWFQYDVNLQPGAGWDFEIPVIT